MKRIIFLLCSATATTSAAAFTYYQFALAPTTNSSNNSNGKKFAEFVNKIPSFLSSPPKRYTDDQVSAAAIFITQFLKSRANSVMYKHADWELFTSTLERKMHAANRRGETIELQSDYEFQGILAEAAQAANITAMTLDRFRLTFIEGENFNKNFIFTVATFNSSKAQSTIHNARGLLEQYRSSLCNKNKPQ